MFSYQNCILMMIQYEIKETQKSADILEDKAHQKNLNRLSVWKRCSRNLCI